MCCSALTQVGFGMLTNLLGEFAPDIVRAVRKQKAGDPRSNGDSI